MSAEEQVSPKSPNFNILGRFSRRNITDTGINSNRMEPGREVVADPVNTTSRMFLFKPAPTFKRLRSQLGKRGRELKGKGKALDSPSLHTLESSAKPVMEPQSTETTDGTVSVGPSQNVPFRDCGDESRNNSFRDCGEEIATENDSSSLKEPVDHEKSDPSFVEDSPSMSTASLARRIHSLLSTFPSPYTLTPSGHFLCPGTSNHASPAEPTSADSTIFSLLSSASVMNGSISKGRESVWAALERLRYSPHPHPKEEPRETGENINATVSNELDAGVADDTEMTSVMICGPLHPTEDTEVEIARSEVVSIDLEETTHEAKSSLPLDKQGVGVSWFFGNQRGKRNDKTSQAIPLAEKALPPPPPKIKEMRVWYPSRTKVSLQAFWWGYRIYLPPPVMHVLSDKSLEAAKRAAMITAALTWLVSHFPTGMLPPPMRAVVGVIKQIVPIMGYVGGFIAWSWNTIQGFDKGQGVTLSATWLLPIALIPGTWFYVNPPDSPSSGISSET